jgi:hypothetical protein
MEIVRHIDYMVERIGIDHVGFGSDFDGVEEIPGDLGSAAGLPRLLNALRERGYDDAALHKIAHGTGGGCWRRPGGGRRGGCNAGNFIRRLSAPKPILTPSVAPECTKHESIRTPPRTISWMRCAIFKVWLIAL